MFRKLVLMFVRSQLRDWAIDYLYRCDYGLFEIEKDYKKKNKIKLLFKDSNYNQLQGKFHAVVIFLQDFGIPPPVFGDRIEKRIIKQHGGKIKRHIS